MIQKSLLWKDYDASNSVFTLDSCLWKQSIINNKNRKKVVFEPNWGLAQKPSSQITLRNCSGEAGFSAAQFISYIQNKEH